MPWLWTALQHGQSLKALIVLHAVLRFASTVNIKPSEAGSVQYLKFCAPLVLPCVSDCSGTPAAVVQRGMRTGEDNS